MSTTIYHVFAFGGQYDDAYRSLIKSWSTKKQADNHVAELIVERDRTKRILDRVWELNNDVHEETPPPDHPGHLEVPRWPPGLGKNQITQQMRDERMVVETHNKMADEAHAAAYRKWNTEVLYARINDYLRSEGIPENELNEYNGSSYICRSHVNYEVEEGQLD